MTCVQVLPDIPPKQEGDKCTDSNECDSDLICNSGICEKDVVEDFANAGESCRDR